MVRIHLPGTQHAKQAHLNIQPQKLSLTVAGKYNLQLSLPHQVSAAEGTASFHSGKQQLEVVLPLVPLPISGDRPNTLKSTMQQQQQQHSRQKIQSQDRGVSDAHELVESLDDAVSAAPLSADVAPPANAAGDELPSVSPSQQHHSQEGEATAQQERDKPSSESLTKNQQKWLDLHPKNAGSTSSDDSMQASTSQAAVAADTSTLRAAAAAGMWKCGMSKAGSCLCGILCLCI